MSFLTIQIFLTLNRSDCCPEIYNKVSVLTITGFQLDGRFLQRWSSVELVPRTSLAKIITSLGPLQSDENEFWYIDSENKRKQLSGWDASLQLDRG